MYMKFGWGEAPEDQPIEVLNVSYSLNNNGGAETLANCIPGDISLTLSAGVRSKPAAALLAFARAQIEKASAEGAGRISVFVNEGDQTPFQEIQFSKAKITHFSQNTSQHDDSVVINVTLAPGFLTVSDVKFEHRTRIINMDRS